MKKTIVIALVFLVRSVFCFAQINMQGNSFAIYNLNKIPQERIFLHYNTSTLFAGEQLLYKLYCINEDTKQFSGISKIGYIELIAKDGSTVFKHKVKLDSGVGNGDFFIPTDVPTGSYKLFGYTRWMQNKGVKSFYESDLAIINPYQKVPKAYLEHPKDSVFGSSTSEDKTFQKTVGLDTYLEDILSIDQTKIGKRKKLTITINSKDVTGGNYSLSVRKQNELVTHEAQSSLGFFEGYNKLPKDTGKENQDLFFLPELRGELISGIVKNKENNTLVSGEKFALSFAGENYLFKISTSDDYGRFYFNIDTPYDNSEVILQQLSEDWEDKDIFFDQNQVEYKGLQFKSFQLNADMKGLIEERSIQNQIENAYVDIKLDKTLNINQKSPFYREFETTFDLDDYTRFNTIPETIIEVVNQVSIKKTAGGERKFYIIPKAGFQDVGFPTILFVDGVFIKNQEDFMDFNAKKIKTISISKDQYLIGSLFFQGLLSVRTIDGDFNKTFNADHLKKVDLFAPQKNKVYFKQDYGADTNNKWDRIPDFRRQLLWEPSLTLKDTEVIEIYTSDVEGDYDICLEGFSSKGKPVTVLKTFQVE